MEIFLANSAISSLSFLPSLANFLLPRMRLHCFASKSDGPPDPLVWLAAFKTSSSSMEANIVAGTVSIGPERSASGRISAGDG